MTTTKHQRPDHDDSGPVVPGSGVVTNWMQNAASTPAVLVSEVTTSEQVQAIVADTTGYPSPLRPVGNVASPSNVCSNDGGTTLVMRGMKAIHGLIQVTVPPVPDTDQSESSTITCIDCEPGCTLRELQRYAHSQGLELPFSAEIGLATIGGTAFATTKDSAIGTSPIPSMGIGDVASMVYKVWVVEDDGQVRSYSFIDEETGEVDPHFQGLLDSYGARGVAVRLWIVARPKTPLTTTLRLWPLKSTGHAELADRLAALQAGAAELNGNVFCAVGWKSKLVLTEERIPVANQRRLAPLIGFGRPYARLKKFLIQGGGGVPSLFHAGRLLSGTGKLTFRESSRPAGNHYAENLSADKKKLTFSYYSFDRQRLPEVVTAALDFTANYEATNGFAPTGFAVYFVTNSGRRLAGPYSSGEGENTREGSFSFDPIHNRPLEPEWEAFCVAFNEFAKAQGGRPSLNQTLGLEQDVSYGGTAVTGEPSPRFTSAWLQQFYDRRPELDNGP